MNDDGTFRLALLLAALAGWVDAAGLGNSGGVFLSFMSGNTTDLAASAIDGHWTRAAAIAAVIALFVLGVILGEIIESRSKRRGQSWVLGIEALALAIGAACQWSDAPIPATVSLFPLVFAMGLQNATMHRAGGINIGLTYVTGTLVQIGRGIAALAGGEPDMRKLGKYAALWLCLATGSALGAIALSLSTSAALFAAAATAGALATVERQ
jgi:uncharacterized membrane protein YoaK (UPF0700 family)